jgi:hypothetical protein
VAAEELAANITGSSAVATADSLLDRPEHCSLASDIEEVAACHITTSNSFAPDIHFCCYSLSHHDADVNSGCCSPFDPHSEVCAGWMHTYLQFCSRCSLCADVCRYWTPPGSPLGTTAITIDNPLCCQMSDSSAALSTHRSLIIAGTLHDCSAHSWVGRRRIV